jgi:hypothetical protein
MGCCLLSFWRKLGAARVPISGLLIGVRQRHNLRLTEVRSTDLDADGQTGSSEAARNRNCGQTVDIEGRSISERRRDARRRSIELGAFDSGGRRRRGGSDEQVHRGEGLLDRTAQMGEFAPPLDIGRRRDFCTALQASPSEGLI